MRFTKKTLVILGLIVATVIVVFAVVMSLRFRVVGTNPEEGKVISIKGAVTIELSKSITNSEEIIKSVVLEPATLSAVFVSDKTITIAPYDGFSVASYAITIPSIKGGGGEIRDFKLSFEAKDLAGEALTADQKKAEADAEVDLDDTAPQQFPYLSHIVTNTGDYDIDYSYNGQVLILHINLHPANEPPLYDTEAYDRAYEAARDTALKFIQSKVSLEQVNQEALFEYSPVFMNDKYGTAQQAEYDEEAETEPSLNE